MAEASQVTRVCCIGAGYVGGPTSAVLAAKTPHVEVVVCDRDTERIAAWNSDTLPLFEPGLEHVVQTAKARDVRSAIQRAELIFIAVNTPSRGDSENGEGGLMGTGYDLAAYEGVARSIAEFAMESCIVVEKSTVPVHTAKSVQAILDANKRHSGIKFTVLSNPEFMAEGTAIRDLEEPERILIGSEDTPQGFAAAASLQALYENWVPSQKIIRTKLFSAELAKLVANAFLAQRISSINSLTAICEASGADISEIAKAIGADSRIGGQFLKAGVGFGGSCFRKDLQGLIYLLEQFHMTNEAAYWRNVLTMNVYQKERFTSSMFGTIKGKTLCVLGFSFKKDTSDTRDSPAIYVARNLIAEGASLHVYDPKVSVEEISSYGAIAASCPYQACLNAHAIVCITDWDEFQELDYSRMFRAMKKPAFIFDGRNFLDHEMLRAIGFQVYSVGKPWLKD